MKPTHGMFIGGRPKTTTYNSWTEMKRRCRAKRGVSVRNYRARGILVCRRWRESFVAFLADMGERPPGKTIERINNSGHYEPGNCCWATNRQQGRNRRTNKTATYRGRTRTLIEWAEFAGIPYQAFWRRVRRNGWSIKRAIETPLMSQFSRAR